MMEAAEATLPGVVKWVPLSVSTRVHLEMHDLDEIAEEVARDPPRGLLVQLQEGELGRAVNGDEQVEPAFPRVNTG